MNLKSRLRKRRENVKKTKEGYIIKIFEEAADCEKKSIIIKVKGEEAYTENGDRLRVDVSDFVKLAKKYDLYYTFMDYGQHYVSRENADTMTIFLDD